MAYINNTLHIPKFGGEIWYVNGVNGSDSNSGKAPDNAFLTIGKAIDSVSSGDAITIMAATYTETSLDLDVASVELWFETGTIIAPASGTCLTISANYCKAICEHGFFILDPAANETAMLVSGSFAYIYSARAKCDSVADIGFDITGNGSVFKLCRCANPLVAAFKIQGDSNQLWDCCTGGEAADTSIGYWATNSCDKTRIRGCGSQGHATSGFQVDTGCTNGVIEACYSGGGDGKWTDADNAFVWSNFSYERFLFTTSTFTATGGVGGAGTNYNLFKITGSVKVFNIYSHVTTVLPATSSVPNLELYSTNAAVDITDAAGGPDITGAVVGTTLAREQPASEPLVMGAPSATPAVIENSDYRDPSTPIILVEDNGADTYIQLTLTAALASGAMHWHVEWEPVTDNGFVAAV